MKNYLVNDQCGPGSHDLPDNVDYYGNGNGCGAGSATASAGGGTGCGRYSGRSKDGGGVGAGSPLATDKGDGRGEGFEAHHALGLLHSGGLDDIREFTTFILLQPLIRRA